MNYKWETVVFGVALASALTMTGCAGITAPTTEYTVDSAVYTALTTEKLVLSRPCTATTTTVCADKTLVLQMKNSRVLLMAALKAYQDARDVYIKSGDASMVNATYQAFQAALAASQGLIGLPATQAILAKVKGAI